MEDYLVYVDEKYSAKRLSTILKEVTRIIGANILSVSEQDYDPLGASATVLVSEEQIFPTGQVFHLDKSHISAHTYPESDERSGLCTFRVDIDVSTCGRVSPLRALNFMIQSFDSDVLTLDYRIRGFTRDVQGVKHYVDHEIQNLLDFVDEDIQKKYKHSSINIYQEHIYHTRMIIKKFLLDDYLFKKEEQKMDRTEREKVSKLIKKEMEEIYKGRNATNSY